MLKFWNGNGVIKLFDYDFEFYVFFLEFCVFGILLSESVERDKIGVILSFLLELMVLVGVLFKIFVEEVCDWFGDLK